MKPETIFISLIAVFAITTLAFWSGYSFKANAPIQKETSYILQKCERDSIDWARWTIEREKGVKEICPKGGNLKVDKNGWYYVECYQN